MSTVTKPLFTNEKADEMIDAIKGVSLGNYVIVNINNYTWGSVAGAGVYPVGAAVTLRATAKEDCFFLCWRNADGDVISTEPEIMFTPSGNTVIQADFNDQAYVKIVPWATGTDVELNGMLQAHYAGVIDIHDYWSVGDSRTVNLAAMSNTDGTHTVGETHAAQNVEFTLMDSTLTGITPTDTDITRFAFAVGLKDGLATAGYMNPTNTNVGGWDECARRGWCNYIFPNSLPATFLPLFKEFKWKLYGGSGADPVLTESTDLFALTPAKCIFGTASYSHADEAALFNHWEWYQTTEHRIKKRGINGSAYYWWESSPRSGDAAIFCRVHDNGSAGYAGASYAYSLAPFGCI